MYNEGVMSAIDDILKRAKSLPAKEKRRLIRQLQAEIARPKPNRRAARQHGRATETKGLTGDELCDFVEKLGPMNEAAKATEEAIRNQPPLEPPVPV